MGFKLEVVNSCPVTKASRGVMTFTPELVAMIAGAVRDRIEWIAYLNGTRSDDGFEVKVDRFTIPKQYRTAGDAEIVERDGDKLADDVVGVIHSHHHMGAFFSGTDVSTLNPRFPSSIVVAISNSAFGFSYKAEGKVVLPCGAVGKVEFVLAVEGVERFSYAVVRGEHGGEVADLGDCLHAEVSNTDDPYAVLEKAACGLFATTDKPLAFGQNGADFIRTVEAETLEKQWSRTIGPGKYSGGVGWNGYDRYFGEREARGGSSGYTSNTNTKLSKREQKRLKKLSARRDGMVRITDGGSDDGFAEKAGSYMFAHCQNCNKQSGMVKKHEFFEQWLCVQCYDEAERTVADAEVEAAKDATGAWNADGLVWSDEEHDWVADPTADAANTGTAVGVLSGAFDMLEERGSFRLLGDGTE